MIQIMVNSLGTKRLVRNGKSLTLKDKLSSNTYNISDMDFLVKKHNLIELPISHESYKLGMVADSKELHATVTLLGFERDLAGVWFRALISRTSSSSREFPCYFTFMPIRKKLGVYDIHPIVNIIHTEGSDLSMFQQDYDSYEPIGSHLRIQDYNRLGVR